MFSTLRRYLPHRLSRLGRFPRWCAVGSCLLLAAQSAATSHRTGGASATATVLVTTRTLPAGHLLSAGDLRRARWPSATRPAGARADAAALVGRRLAGPVGAGEPITGTRLVGPDLAAGLPGNVVAAAVPLADPHAVELVRPGDRIQLLGTVRADDVAAPPAGGVDVLLSGARVLAALAGSDGSTGAELVVAVPPAVAARIVRDEPTHVFTAVLAPP